MVFHGNLNDNKSPQVSRTLLGILAVLNNAVVIYEALCFDVTQGQMNGAHNETRTHWCRFASLVCKPLHHQRCPSQQCCSFDGFRSSSYFQVFLYLYQSFVDDTDFTNYNYRHFHVPCFFL